MRLTVTGLETVEIRDPQGLCAAQKPANGALASPGGVLEALREGTQPGTRLKPLPAAPFTPFPGLNPPRTGPYTTPTSPHPGPYTGNPLVNPIPLPGYTPAARPSVPWAQWTHLTGTGDRWARGLQAAHDLRIEEAGFGQKNKTEQEW